MGRLVYKGDFSVRTKIGKGGLITLLEADGIGKRVNRGDVLSLPAFTNVEVMLVESKDSLVVYSENKVSKDFIDSVISVL